MNPQQRHWLIVIGLLLAAGGSILILGCQSEGQTAGVEAMPESGLAQFEETPPPIVAAGAKLWEQNCIRCHNVRTPATLSDAQWRVVMHHMRVRAGLTAGEHEAILRFLQSAN